MHEPNKTQTRKQKTLNQIHALGGGVKRIVPHIVKPPALIFICYMLIRMIINLRGARTIQNNQLNTLSKRLATIEEQIKRGNLATDQILKQLRKLANALGHSLTKVVTSVGKVTKLNQVRAY